jgi:hypothetical protein
MIERRGRAKQGGSNRRPSYRKLESWREKRRIDQEEKWRKRKWSAN